jgi:hypothetical protein
MKERTSGAKARPSFCGICGTAKQLAEKLHIPGQRLERFPMRLKPHIEKETFYGTSKLVP